MSINVLYHSLVLGVCYSYRSVVNRRDDMLRLQKVSLSTKKISSSDGSLYEKVLGFSYITLNVHHMQIIYRKCVTDSNVFSCWIHGVVCCIKPLVRN